MKPHWSCLHVVSLPYAQGLWPPGSCTGGLICILGRRENDALLAGVYGLRCDLPTG